VTLPDTKVVPEAPLWALAGGGAARTCPVFSFSSLALSSKAKSYPTPREQKLALHHAVLREGNPLAYKFDNKLIIPELHSIGDHPSPRERVP
jgi:hypothetical protein